MDTQILELVVRFFVLTVSLTIHEASHAGSAYYLGDDTSARMGRLSLNPLVHMDPLGSLMILMGMPIGWAKPVPVNPFRFKDMRRDMALVSFAGPASNLVLGALFCFIFFATNTVIMGTSWVQIILLFVHMNFALAVFNLLPLYPLDGSKVLPLLLPGKLASRYEEAIARFSYWPLMILVLMESFTSRGPLRLWFELWGPVLSPIYRIFGVPSYW